MYSYLSSEATVLFIGRATLGELSFACIQSSQLHDDHRLFSELSVFQPGARPLHMPSEFLGFGAGVPT